MKKQILSIACLLVTLTTATANADQGHVLSCAKGQNKLLVRILPVSGDQSLRVLGLKGDLLIIATDPEGNNSIGKTAHIEGHLVGTSHESGIMGVSGIIENQDGSDVIINPQSINVMLSPNNDGSTTLSIYDEDRIFQRGFGLHLICK